MRKADWSPNEYSSHYLPSLYIRFTAFPKQGPTSYKGLLYLRVIKGVAYADARCIIRYALQSARGGLPTRRSYPVVPGLAIPGIPTQAPTAADQADPLIFRTI
jgi:hypothetical protein